MRIHDLTGGKYPTLVGDPQKLELLCVTRLKNNWPETNISKVLFHSPRVVINFVPIFLVETSMADTDVFVKDLNCDIHVPKDHKKQEIEPKEFDEKPVDKLDEKPDSDYVGENRPNNNPGSHKEKPGGYTVEDYLGVYVYDPSNDTRRIFVWVDKIQNYTLNPNRAMSTVTKNAKALLELVMFHELGHALMDVGLYRINSSPYFTYSNNYIYRFIEEACANAFGLMATMKYNKPWQKKFIEKFVKKQGAGYRDGWELYEDRDCKKFFAQWMYIKVLYDYDIACRLGVFRNNKDFSYLEIVKVINHPGWLAVKDRYHQWGFFNLSSSSFVNGNKYDFIWSFTSYSNTKLCLVKDNGKYGYIDNNGNIQIPIMYDNIYNFENGITIAKLNGQYGAIDINNNVVIPFGLPYVDVREFRNGLADVKDQNGKWGVIDSKGILIVPCTKATR